MSDYRSLLERQMERMHPRPFPIEDLIRRRNRKHRVGRLVAVAVGLAIALIAAAAGSVFLRSSPVPAGPNPSHENGALTYIGDHGRVVLLNRATGATRVLTPPNTSSFDWSPDGSQLAYANLSNRQRLCVLWVLDMRTNERRVLNTRTNERRPLVNCPNGSPGLTFDWSPDGERLAFDHSRLREGERYFRSYKIAVIDAGGGDPILLTGPGRPFERSAFMPTWSPDGTRLAFSSVVGDVWVMDADGSHPHEIARGAFPAWSPDGSTIALLRDPRDPRGPSEIHGDPYVLQVWLVDPDGGSGQRGQRLAGQRGCCIGAIPYLAWSPDGRKIALTGVEFWVIDVMDGSVRVVRRAVSQPAWRPAG
jgi:Tol biopolymer transport system component